MFKLKAGNVIQKLNKMDRKQAYTLGAIVVVVFIALLTLASFMGKADDTSFDGLSSRNYDLAQMPFANDEAEAYLLASKYPDMQGTSGFLYSEEEKEARQAEDEELNDSQEDDEEDIGEHTSTNNAYSSTGYSGRGYGGAGGRGSTAVGQLGHASMQGANGSGMSGTWGTPRGDFSPYKSQDKGTEIPQLKNSNARKALSQFAQTSRAAAGLLDGKAANAKRALQGGNIKGSDAFSGSGVDLSKSGGLALDTDAPTSTPDLNDLDKDLNDAAENQKKEDDEEEQDMWDRLTEQLLSGLINMGTSLVGDALNNGIDTLLSNAKGNSATRKYGNDMIDRMKEFTPQNCTKQCDTNMKGLLGDKYDGWKNGDKSLGTYMKDNNIHNSFVRGNMKTNASSISTSFDAKGNVIQVGQPGATTYQQGRDGARLAGMSGKQVQYVSSQPPVQTMPQPSTTTPSTTTPSTTTPPTTTTPTTVPSTAPTTPQPRTAPGR